MRTLDRAVGKWANILVALGVPSHVVNGKHQRCPICKNGKDTFRFDPAAELGTWFCGYCPQQRKIGIDFLTLYFNVDNKEALNMIDSVIGKGIEPVKMEKRDPAPMLRRAYKQMREPEKDVIEYLKSRGLRPTKEIKQATLKYWHDGKDYGNFECMTAIIQDATGKAQSIHITYLKDGRKADLPVDKKIMTPIDTITGGAIRLGGIKSVIGIAEGIETALSCSKMLGGIPVWATISANGMEKFEPPEGVKSVIIFADNDDNYVGQSSAFNCARRLTSQGFIVDVRIPVREDFNDDLMAYLKGEE